MQQEKTALLYIPRKRTLTNKFKVQMHTLCDLFELIGECTLVIIIRYALTLTAVCKTFFKIVVCSVHHKETKNECLQ